MGSEIEMPSTEAKNQLSEEQKQSGLRAEEAQSPDILRREVSCRVLVSIFQALEKRGLPPKTILEGVDYPLEHLRNKHERIDWESFGKLMSNAGQIWNDQELVALGEEVISSPWIKPFMIITRLLYSPSDFYHWLTQPGTGGHLVFTCVQPALHKVGPAHLIFELTMQPGYKASREFFLISKGTLISAPEVLGLKKADVEMEETVNGARYHIHLPKEQGPLHWLRNLITRPFTARAAAHELKEAYEVLQQRYQELEAQISERKQTETAYRASQQTLQTILNSITDYVWSADVIDGEVSYHYYSPVVEKITGYPPDYFMSGVEAWLDIIHPDDRPVAEQKLVQEFAGEIVEHEYRIIRSDGEIRWLHGTTSPTTNDDGIVTRLVGVVSDITDRKQAEEALRESSRKLTKLAEEQRILLEHTRDFVYRHNREGIFTYLSPAVKRITGYSIEEWQNLHYADPLTDNPVNKQSVIYTEKTLQTGEESPPYRVEIFHKNGQRVMLEIKEQPYFEGEQVAGIVGVARDITEHKRLEEQLIQAQKMEAIGTLAGGIAHDFNNMLTAIMGYAEFALETLPAEHSARSDLQGIRKISRRAAELTSQLLAFARRQIIEPQVVSLNSLILSMSQMLGRLIGENIELVTLPAPNLWQVQIDPGQFEQVIVNLVVNARDAMPNGGKLIIETANITLDKEQTQQYAEIEPGQYVMLSVTDTGLGISEEVRPHLFEPFFTTKEVGKGTGLGLATCFGIVKQNNGHIQVDSEPNQGATFKVYLPRVREKADRAAMSTQFEELPVGKETVLVVEDENSLRDLAVRVLQNQGYTVLAAHNGVEALTLVREQAETPIDLLVTDMVMPHMGGKMLAKQLKESQPNLKVLFISGYTDQTTFPDGLLEEEAAFLQKPFSPYGLANKVRQVLDNLTSSGAQSTE